jgi:hypothetical protein
MVLTPNVEKGTLVEQSAYESDQESFVCFLQTGLLRSNDGMWHDFTAGFPANLVK